ncbi:hypothetical protein AMECASPLE_005637 [Ameca splendens]|uniref:Uncharacterized protein n=1 Tax=Ameca splendens TaxID=208324 RepID=A0ABV0XN80_9TELE
MSESGCLRACCFLFPPLGAVELEDRRCDRCSSLTHQFRGLYEGGSPALLRLSVFALHGTSALLLIGALKKTSDHSLDSGFIPCSRPHLDTSLSGYLSPCPPSYGSSWIIKKPQRNQHCPTVPGSQPFPPWRIAPPE